MVVSHGENLLSSHGNKRKEMIQILNDQLKEKKEIYKDVHTLDVLISGVKEKQSKKFKALESDVVIKKILGSNDKNQKTVKQALNVFIRSCMYGPFSIYLEFDASSKLSFRNSLSDDRVNLYDSIIGQWGKIIVMAGTLDTNIEIIEKNLSVFQKDQGVSESKVVVSLSDSKKRSIFKVLLYDMFKNVDKAVPSV